MNKQEYKEIVLRSFKETGNKGKKEITYLRYTLELCREISASGLSSTSYAKFLNEVLGKGMSLADFVALVEAVKEIETEKIKGSEIK